MREIAHQINCIFIIILLTFLVLFGGNCRVCEGWGENTAMGKLCPFEHILSWPFGACVYVIFRYNTWSWLCYRSSFLLM